MCFFPDNDKASNVAVFKVVSFFDKSLKQNVTCKQSGGEHRCNVGLMYVLF